MCFRYFFLLGAVLSAQTNERPVRAVTDPGVVTTRQSISPAGVPSVFNGRVYGVQFRSATELQVLTALGVYRMDWQQNKVLRHTEARGRGETAGQGHRTGLRCGARSIRVREQHDVRRFEPVDHHLGGR